MYMQQNRMGMQANPNQSPGAPMMMPPTGPQMMGKPAWASQMGPQQPPMAPSPGMGPPPMANGQAAMAPGSNPIDPQVAGMMGGEGMTGAAAANPYMGAAMMGMNMMAKKEAGSQEVIARRNQMNHQVMERMQQIAAMMRSRMQGTPAGTYGAGSR